jgi:hypothetical protein
MPGTAVVVTVLNETSGSIKGGKILSGQGKNEHCRCGSYAATCTPMLPILDSSITSSP